MNKIEKLILERISDEVNIKKANHIYTSILKYVRTNDISNSEAVYTLVNNNGVPIGIGINIQEINLRASEVRSKFFKQKTEDDMLELFKRNITKFLPRLDTIHEIIHFLDDTENKSYSTKKNHKTVVMKNTLTHLKKYKHIQFLRYMIIEMT